MKGEGSFFMDLEPRDMVIALAVKHNGDWNRVYAGLKCRDELTDEEAAALAKSVRSKTLTFLDPDYPQYLLDGCIRPPFCLFYYGDISLIHDSSRVLTVVGSREPSDYATNKTREICHDMIKKGYILCSGLAYGIDTIAAEEGAKIRGGGIAVLGCGIDNMYPLENVGLKRTLVHRGLVLSEYPGDAPPDSKNFPMRNRILAGLGSTTFASEIKNHSGTSITVAYALAMNKDVGVLPFQAGEMYLNNNFIKGGAALIESSEDLLLMMKGAPRK